MIDLCLECDLGRLERVLGGENDFDPERTFVIRWVVLEVSTEVSEGSSGQQMAEQWSRNSYLQEQ